MKTNEQQLENVVRVIAGEALYTASDVLEGGCFDDLKEFVYARNV